MTDAKVRNGTVGTTRPSNEAPEERPVVSDRPQPMALQGLVNQFGQVLRQIPEDAGLAKGGRRCDDHATASMLAVGLPIACCRGRLLFSPIPLPCQDQGRKAGYTLRFKSQAFLAIASARVDLPILLFHSTSR